MTSPQGRMTIQQAMHDGRYTHDGLFNFSKWSRENVPKPPPQFAVGDTVIFTIETTITHVGADCDGTTLYGADMIGFGWAEGHFAKKTP